MGIRGLQSDIYLVILILVRKGMTRIQHTHGSEQLAGLCPGQTGLWGRDCAE